MKKEILCSMLALFLVGHNVLPSFSDPAKQSASLLNILHTNLLSKGKDFMNDNPAALFDMRAELTRIADEILLKQSKEGARKLTLDEDAKKRLEAIIAEVYKELVKENSIYHLPFLLLQSGREIIKAVPNPSRILKAELYQIADDFQQKIRVLLRDEELDRVINIIVFPKLEAEYKELKQQLTSKYPNQSYDNYIYSEVAEYKKSLDRAENKDRRESAQRLQDLSDIFDAIEIITFMHCQKSQEPLLLYDLKEKMRLALGKSVLRFSLLPKNQIAIDKMCQEVSAKTMLKCPTISQLFSATPVNSPDFFKSQIMQGISDKKLKQQILQEIMLPYTFAPYAHRLTNRVRALIESCVAPGLPLYAPKAGVQTSQPNQGWSIQSQAQNPGPKKMPAVTEPDEDRGINGRTGSGDSAGGAPKNRVGDPLEVDFDFYFEVPTAKAETIKKALVSTGQAKLAVTTGTSSFETHAKVPGNQGGPKLNPAAKAWQFPKASSQAGHPDYVEPGSAAKFQPRF